MGEAAMSRRRYDAGQVLVAVFVTIVYLACLIALGFVIEPLITP